MERQEMREVRRHQHLRFVLGSFERGESENTVIETVSLRRRMMTVVAAADRLGSSRRRRGIILRVDTPASISAAAHANNKAATYYSAAADDKTESSGSSIETSTTSIFSTRTKKTNNLQDGVENRGASWSDTTTWKKLSSSSAPLDERGNNQRAEKANNSPGRYMQLLYLFAFYAGWTYVFLGVYPLADEDSITVGSYHRVIGVVVFLACALSWFLASNVSPGNITRESMAKYDNYHYDNLLYVNRVCPTLQIRKLPRSKFDRYSRTHVPRFDHFCPVLMQAVGEENYRFYLAFLIVHTGMCFYGCDILCRLLWGIVLQDPTISSKLLAESKLSFLTLLRRFVAILFLNHPLEYLVALLFVCSLIMTKLLGFHLYLIARGMTTNEYYKWQDVWDVYEYERLRWKDKQAQKIRAARHHAGTTTAAAAATHDVESPVSSGAVTGSAKQQQQQQQKQKQANIGRYKAPKNSYNLGIVNNVHEVLFPRCFRAQNQENKLGRAKST